MTPWDTILRLAKILIVEDDRSSRLLLERLMEQVGYKRWESTGDPAEAAMLHKEIEPDLVLLDLNLAGELSGTDLLHLFNERADPRGFSPVMVITADANPATRLQVLNAGAKDFLTKPIDTLEARLRIRTLLETRFVVLELIRELETLRTRPGKHLRIVDDV